MKKKNLRIMGANFNNKMMKGFKFYSKCFRTISSNIQNLNSKYLIKAK